MNSLAPAFSLERTEFLDLLSGVRRPSGARTAAMLDDVSHAVATVTVAAPPPGGDTTMLWIGGTHTTIVSGESPVLVNRIKTANAPIALIGLLGLRRTAEPEAIQTAPTRWRVRLDGATTDSWEVIDRSPGGSWLVSDHGQTTRVEPTSVAGIVGRICATLQPVISPI